MHPRLRILVPLLTGLAFCSCSLHDAAQQEPAPSALPDKTSSGIPRAGKNIKLYGNNAVSDAAATTSSQNTPRVTLPESFIIQQILNLNLDSDPEIEQVVVFKLRDSSDDFLNIAIIDFDASRNAWLLSWQGPTRATNVRSFSLRTRDLSKDGLPEIIALGVNEKGEQTLDVYRIDATKTRELGLQYVSVLSITADVSIDLPEANNSTATLSPDMSVPQEDDTRVRSLSKDLESTNNLDMIETMYLWKPSPGQFVIQSTTKIPGTQVQEKNLDQLFKSSKETVEEFLRGSWTRSTKDAKGKVSVQTIFFDSDSRNIHLIEGDRLESQTWKATHKPVYGGRLTLYLVNEAFKSLSYTADVSIESMNTLTFAMQNHDSWSGVFTRGEDSKVSQDGNPHDIGLNNLVLSGLFRSESGAELLFSSPSFTFRKGDVKKTGAFVTYNLDGAILELTYISAAGLVESRESFSANLVKNELSNGKIQWILELQSVKLTIDGPESTGAELVRYEQIPGDFIE